MHDRTALIWLGLLVCPLVIRGRGTGWRVNDRSVPAVGVGAMALTVMIVVRMRLVLVVL